jgi:serine/threonine protein kinase
MNKGERVEIAEIAKDMLAATVIHPYNLNLGIKIYKNNADGRRQANRALSVYRQDIERLPGLPSANVQKIVRADHYNKERNYIIQEWISGDSLEYLQIKNAIEPAHIRPIIKQLFLNIIILLWTKGTVWWDSRDGNYCFDSNT